MSSFTSVIVDVGVAAAAVSWFSSVDEGAAVLHCSQLLSRGWFKNVQAGHPHCSLPSVCEDLTVSTMPFLIEANQ